MAGYKELRAKAEELFKQAEEARKSEVAAVIAEIRAKMAEFSISVTDLRESKRRVSAASGKVAPKYRDPASGQTWTGRGREPRWLAAYMAKGRKKDEFRIP